MWTIMALICFVIGIIATYIRREDLIELWREEDLFFFAFISIYREGYADGGEILLFIASLFLYIFLLAILSLIWIVTVPVLLLLLFVKLILKKKS